MSEAKSMNLTLKVWRQKNAKEKGRFETYEAKDISNDMSFLEMLDVVNEDLIRNGDDPIVFDHDCREGICGSCSLVINGIPHGPERGTATCQLHMRSFNDGETIFIEPWRAKAFPLIKDLMVNREAFDSIIQAGGYVSVNTGNADDANTTPIPPEKTNSAMDAAACIGCGACVAACKNASAHLFLSAKVSQFAILPQGHPERGKRVREMVHKADEMGFGNCSNTGDCEAVCPKEISIENIARMNREYVRALFEGKDS
jgi:succinate dehydrogenase / fumarate reductase iron-sulfur subunit